MTGAGGFVGRHLCDALMNRQAPAEVIKLLAEDLSCDNGLKADIIDRTAVDIAVSQTCPNVVVHLAAQSSVAQSVADAHDTWAVNLSGSLNLASAMARHAPNGTMLFVSSSEVYGASFLLGPVSETTPTLPMNAYAQSKRIAEDVCAAVLPVSAQLIVARPFTHSGPGQREDFALPSFAYQVARIELGLQPPQIRVGNVHVERDFMHVRDVVAAYLALIDNAERLPRRFVCNVASGQRCPLSHTIDVLRGLARREFEVVVDPRRVRAHDIPSASGDATLLRKTTGWTPKESVESLMAALLEDGRRSFATA